MLMWDEYMNVDIRNMNKNIIKAYVFDQQNRFQLSCIYGHQKLQFRQQVWDQLTLVAQSLK